MSYVLIVDDEISMTETLSDMLNLLGYETRVAYSPRRAMEAIIAELPRMILLDLNMPGVDGVEVCRYIKRDPEAKHTPVVFISAEDDPSVVQRAKEAGAAAFLTKPVDLDQLEQLLLDVPARRPGIASRPARRAL
jgi:CheY-like chemotaxis protein